MDPRRGRVLILLSLAGVLLVSGCTQQGGGVNVAGTNSPEQTGAPTPSRGTQEGAIPSPSAFQPTKKSVRMLELDDFPVGWFLVYSGSSPPGCSPGSRFNLQSSGLIPVCPSGHISYEDKVYTKPDVLNLLVQVIRFQTANDAINFYNSVVGEARQKVSTVSAPVGDEGRAFVLLGIDPMLVFREGDTVGVLTALGQSSESTLMFLEQQAQKIS